MNARRDERSRDVRSREDTLINKLDSALFVADKQRIFGWVLTVTALLLVANIVLTLNQSEQTQQDIDDARQRGNITRQLLCETVVYDNDRESDVPSVCFSPEIVDLYEPSFCASHAAVCTGSRDEDDGG